MANLDVKITRGSDSLIKENDQPVDKTQIQDGGEEGQFDGVDVSKVQDLAKAATGEQDTDTVEVVVADEAGTELFKGSYDDLMAIAAGGASASLSTSDGAAISTSGGGGVYARGYAGVRGTYMAMPSLDVAHSGPGVWVDGGVQIYGDNSLLSGSFGVMIGDQWYSGDLRLDDGAKVTSKASGLGFGLEAIANIAPFTKPYLANLSFDVGALYLHQFLSTPGNKMETTNCPSSPNPGVTGRNTCTTAGDRVTNTGHSGLLDGAGTLRDADGGSIDSFQVMVGPRYSIPTGNENVPEVAINGGALLGMTSINPNQGSGPDGGSFTAGGYVGVTVPFGGSKTAGLARTSTPFEGRGDTGTVDCTGPDCSSELNIGGGFAFTLQLGDVVEGTKEPILIGRLVPKEQALLKGSEITVWVNKEKHTITVDKDTPVGNGYNIETKWDNIKNAVNPTGQRNEMHMIVGKSRDVLMNFTVVPDTIGDFTINPTTSGGSSPTGVSLAPQKGKFPKGTKIEIEHKGYEHGWGKDTVIRGNKTYTVASDTAKFDLCFGASGESCGSTAAWSGDGDKVKGDQMTITVTTPNGESFTHVWNPLQERKGGGKAPKKKGGIR